MANELMIDGLHQVALTTKDIARACDFYRDTLGLELMTVIDPPGLAFFDVFGVRLSLMQDDETEPSDSVIYFRVPDIDSAVAALKAKSVTLEQEPEMVFKDDEGRFGNAGEEEWMAFFCDPDGNLLALASRKKT
jgi:catechol 2,3-dioxygenase-like lactoylglutathione lyase family enzyme